MMVNSSITQDSSDALSAVNGASFTIKTISYRLSFPHMKLLAVYYMYMEGLYVREQIDFKYERSKRTEQWNSFMDFGILIQETSPVIAESWIRSRESGVNPYNPSIMHLTTEELQALRRENKDLIRFATPLMDKLFALAKDSINVMSLHDKNGYMLEIINHDSPHGNWRESVFRPGVRWKEEDVGTNGVGLVLKTQQPVQIFGAEHYCYMQREIACAAAPIHNAEGSLVGVLNLSGPFVDISSQPLALVSYGAYAIESQVSLHYSYEFLNRTMDSISESLLLFNGQFQVMRCSRHAAKMFKTSSSAIIGKPIEDILNVPDIKNRLLQSKNSYNILEQECKLGSQTVSCSLTITPMYNQQNLIGGIILLQETKNLNKTINRFAGNFARYTFDDIITSDDKVFQIINSMKRAADTDCGILIEGESGTGKELFAHAIHSYSPRRNKPFIAINCASLPRSLVESELFGYEKGSFSGALSSGNPGKFELADGGTIFLDEIGELPLEIQSKLLRVLDTHRVSRLGGKTEKDLDIRIIAATNRDLLNEIKNQSFREDLYYRLNIFKYHIPPLRERQGDVPILATAFVNQQNLKEGTSPKVISPELMEILSAHSWRGNVRELQNAVTRAYYCCPSDEILPKHIGDINDGFRSAATVSNAPDTSTATSVSSMSVLSVEEHQAREDLIALIRSNAGDLVQVAAALGISRATLYRKLKKYRISPKRL